MPRLAGTMTLHILVVDDDGDVRPLLVEMLRESGYAVTPADSGAAMREILTREALAVDAVVLDCLMPGEPSAQLALHAKSLRLPVVMISGSLEAMQFADDNGLQLLTKPFRARDLLSAIDDAMRSGEFGQRHA
jgi:two-component system OmpR family response regulator